MGKIIAPIIITLIVLGFTLFYVVILVMTSTEIEGLFYIFLIGLIILLVILMLAMVYVLFQRIKEIKEEDKDDLSKY